MTLINSYDWLLFDADGTLFDFDLAELTALQYMFEEKGLVYQPSYGETYRRVNRQVWAEYEQHIVTAVELRTRRFDLLIQSLALNSHIFNAVDLSTRYLHHLGHQSQMVPGARQLLAQLSEKFHLGLITNGLQDVQRARLAHSGIEQFFQLIAISEEMGVAKPHATYFDQVFMRMNHPPRSRTLVIGDSLSSDIAGGNGYGVDTCWFNPHNLPLPIESERRPTYQIQALSQLLTM